jgi:hypothetical protein
LVSVLVSVWTPEPPKPLLHTQLELEARVGIERGSFTVPSLTHSVSRLSISLFYRGSSGFLDRPLNARSLPCQRPFIARQVKL